MLLSRLFIPSFVSLTHSRSALKFPSPFLPFITVNEENPLEVSRRTFLKSGFVTPLDEVDAAARILDPVLEPLAAAQGEACGICSPVWGAFLKDYHNVEW